MTQVDGISLLEQLIVSHPNLKVEDRPVISKLCSQIRIQQDHGFINEYFRHQVEAEATATYLIGRYTSIIDKFQSMLDKHKAGKYMELGEKNDEGYKWTKKSREEYLLGSDGKYSVLIDTLAEAIRLMQMLKGLSDIVFGRDRKLEQLSINYRREMETDRRRD